VPHRPLNRILVVDDDPDVLEVVSLALSALGSFTVETCGEPSEAVQRAADFGPDLVLLDIMMPGLDGLGILAALRAREATADTPVVLVSAQVHHDDLEHYEALGCLGIIPKPFDPSTLPARVQALWGVHERRSQEAHAREFEALRVAYVLELPEKIVAMQAAATALGEGGWDRTMLESLYHHAHRMAGSAGLYRLPALSRTAGALEEVLKRMLGDGAWPPASAPADLALLVQAVGRTARNEARLTSPAPPRRTG
jgi:two-component system OmpR family response regulator